MKLWKTANVVDFSDPNYLNISDYLVTDYVTISLLNVYTSLLFFYSIKIEEGRPLRDWYYLIMSGILFTGSIEAAITEAIQFNKVLVVYTLAKDNDDKWLRSWFNPRIISEKLQDKSVWLRVVKGTSDFDNFEALFSSIQTQSLYFIKDQNIQMIIHGDNGDGKFSHWNRIVNYLENADTTSASSNAASTTTSVPTSTSTDAITTPKDKTANESIKSDKKTFKEEINATTQKIYQAELQRQRKIAKEERERILRLVNGDKQERKVRELQDTYNKVKTIGDALVHEEIEVIQPEINDNIKDNLDKDECALLIKLTNSDTIRNDFPSSSTLKDVRLWVNENRTDGSISYLFHRNIPRVTFSLEGENKSLKELHLTPRSALILDPNVDDHLNFNESRFIGRLINRFAFWRGSSETTFNKEDSDINEEKEDMIKDSTPNDGASNSPPASKFESPATFPYRTQIASEPSDLDLSLRSSTPNVAKFVNEEDSKAEKKDRPTYNGNNINLESKKDD